jgi:hypothetical protein
MSYADVTGGKPITVELHLTSGVSAVNPFSRLLRHPWKKLRGAILLFCPGHQKIDYVDNSLTHTKTLFKLITAYVA